MTRPLSTTLRRIALAFTFTLVANACATTPVPATPKAALVGARTDAEAGAGQAKPALAAAPQIHLDLAGRMERAVTSFGAAATETDLYVLGGYFGKAHEYFKEGQSTVFARMNLETGAWQSLGDVERNQSASLNAHAGKLFRIGGMRIDNAKGEPDRLLSLDTVAIYDPALATWRSETPLPKPRSSHDALFVGDDLYVVGGWTLAGDSKTAVWQTDVLVADTKQSPLVWRAVPAPMKARALGVAALGTRIYVVGGITPAGALSNEVHIYDTQAQSWSRGPDFPEPAFGLAAAELDGTLFASGPSGNVWTLASGGAQWQGAGALAFPRIFHRMVSTPGHVLFVGGIPGHRSQGRVAHIERLGLGVPEQRVSSFALKAPYPAKNRQGLLSWDGKLYLFGGNSSLGQHDFAKENFSSEGANLDLSSLEWTAAPAFPAARQSMQAIVHAEGAGYALGGFGPGGAKLASQSDAFCFDPETNTWSALKRGLPEPRTQFGLVDHGERLWVFGGLDFDDSKRGPEQFVHPTQVLTLDLRNSDAGFVDAGLAIPHPRRAFAGALLGNKYYLVGGMASGFATVDTCDVYDFATDQWSTIPGPSRTRIGAEAVVLGGRLYIIAGRAKDAGGEFQAEDSIEVFDPSTNQWTVALDKLPMKDTHQLRAIEFRGRILIYSAQREDGQVEFLLVDPS